MRKSGFTLMELIIVIIIVGILASVGFGQYQRIIERSRTSEAKTILGQIRTAQEAYRTETGTYTDDIILNTRSILIDTTVPDVCVPTHYYTYVVSGSDTSNFVATATRCEGANGKTPGVPAGTTYDIILTQDGTFSDSTGGSYL